LGHERREHPRIKCNDTRFSGAFRLPDGTIREFRLVGRNVSRGGVSFMSDRTATEGSRIDVVLPTREGEMIGVSGQVRSCRNVGFVLHEIGVQFEDPLDETSFGELAIVPQRP